MLAFMSAFSALSSVAGLSQYARRSNPAFNVTCRHRDPLELPRRNPLLPLCGAGVVHTGSCGIHCHGNGHVDHVKFVDRFHAQIGKAQHFTVPIQLPHPAVSWKNPRDRGITFFWASKRRRPSARPRQHRNISSAHEKTRKSRGSCGFVDFQFSVSLGAATKAAL